MFPNNNNIRFEGNIRFERYQSLVQQNEIPCYY